MCATVRRMITDEMAKVSVVDSEAWTANADLHWVLMGEGVDVSPVALGRMLSQLGYKSLVRKAKSKRTGTVQAMRGIVGIRLRNAHEQVWEHFSLYGDNYGKVKSVRDR